MNESINTLFLQAESNLQQNHAAISEKKLMHTTITDSCLTKVKITAQTIKLYQNPTVH